MRVQKVDPVSHNEEWIVKSVVSFGSCVLLFAATAAVIVFCIYKTNSAIKFSYRITIYSTQLITDPLIICLRQEREECIINCFALCSSRLGKTITITT